MRLSFRIGTVCSLWFLLSGFQVCVTTPSRNIDSTPLTDLQEIRLLIGTSSRNYDYRIVPESETRIGTDICYNYKVAPGQYYVAAVAVNVDGDVSDYSNEVMKTEARGLGTPTGGRLNTPAGGRILDE